MKVGRCARKGCRHTERKHSKVLGCLSRKRWTDMEDEWNAMERYSCVCKRFIKERKVRR